MKVGSGVIVKRPHRITQSEFIHVGDHTLIHQNALISPIPVYAGVKYHPEVRIGRDVYIGPNLFLACIGLISIGEGSALSEGVYINDSNHVLDPESGTIMKQVLTHKSDIIIGKSCFLGLRSAILPGGFSATTASWGSTPS
jgi:acetyltransferase-like isoleucine patch superfamily enzyme